MKNSPHLHVLIVAASLRFMGGQAVMAKRLIQDLSDEGVRVEFLPVDPELPGFLGFVRRIKYLRTVVCGIFYWFTLLRRVRHHDVIHVFSASYWSFLISPTPAILAGRLFRKPVVLHYHSGEAEDHLQRSSFVTHWLLGLPERIVVPSGYLVKVFEKFGFSAEPIANHLDNDDAIFRRRTRLEPNIIVSRALEPNYNIPCAIRVFERVKKVVPDARMTILGEGALRESLEQMIAQRNLEGIHMAGRVERDQIWQVYDEHDIFLNTSSVDNMPISILEAFAAGLPVVTTDAGGIPFMIEDGQDGYLVPVDDDESAANRIIHLLENPDEALRLGQGATDRLARYEWKQVGKQWLTLYAQVTSCQRCRDPFGAPKPKPLSMTKGN